MKSKIALILPAYNEEKTIESSLNKLKSGIDLFPEYDFYLYITDDHSTDNTSQIINKWKTRQNLPVILNRNPKNLGLVDTLKAAYKKTIEDNSDFILRTDLDLDFDQKEVLQKLMPLIYESDVTVGIANRIIQDPYEISRKKEILQKLKDNFGLVNLDPSLVGTQMYNAKALSEILKQPEIIEHSKRWGLDFLMVLCAKKLGFKIKIIKFNEGTYKAERRPKEKIELQYGIYDELLKKFLNLI